MLLRIGDVILHEIVSTMMALLKRDATHAPSCRPATGQTMHHGSNGEAFIASSIKRFATK